MNIIIERITNNHTKFMGDGQVVFINFRSCNIEFLVTSGDLASKCEIEIKADDLVYNNETVDYVESVKKQLCKLFKEQ